MGRIKVVVYGYGDWGKKIISQLKCDEIEVVGVIDNYLEEVEEYRLWTAQTFIQEAVEVDYVVFAMRYYVSKRIELISQIKDSGYNLLLVPSYYFEYDKEMSKGVKFLNENCVPVASSRLIDIVEFVINEGCNLNCKGCSQFSPLFEKNEYVNIKTFTKDIQQLKKICSNVLRIQLLGGEVFLLKDLDLYLNIARETFPEARINILSNGILIPQLSDKVVNSIRDNGIIVNLTTYAPTLNMIDMIEKFANDHKILVHYTKDIRDNFVKTLLSERIEDGGECTCNIPAIYRGKVAACSDVMVIRKFNNYFGTNFPEDGAIDLYNVDLTFERFKKILYGKAPLCDYCVLRTKFKDNKKYNYQWEVYGSSLPQKNDWIYEG